MFAPAPAPFTATTSPKRALGFLGLCLLLCLACLPADGAVRVALLSTPKLRAVEELVLVGLQNEPGLEFLERTQLPLLAEELSLGQLLDRAGWSACDALVLLDTFAGQDRAPPSLIVRIVSTHDLKIMGLWVYPLLEKRPELIAERLVARLRPALGQARISVPRHVVSLALLRADEPRLALLTQPATCQLAAQLAAYPELALIERWNVRDPAFEQWLRQSQPTDIRPPDLLINGALTTDGDTLGLRLDINGANRAFPSPGPTHDLASAIIAASRAIAATEHAPPPAPEQEIKRYEQDARWFWKWSAFSHAAASAETALFLGSKNPETAYIRALANLRPSRSYVSTDRDADTPDAETFSRALYGLDCLLRIPEPAPSLPREQQLPRLRYLEQSVEWVGALLEGLYFSAESLPGTPGERAQLRRLAGTLADVSWTFYRKFDHPANSYVPTLEQIDSYGSNLTLPVALLNYASFMEPDAQRLAALYAKCIEELARRQNPNDNVLLFLAMHRQRHRAWFIDWDGRLSGPAERAASQALLLDHPKPEVRLLAGLLPLLCRAADHPGYRGLAAAWLADLAGQWTAEADFFTRRPSAFSNELISLSNVLLSENAELLRDRLPVAEWHRFYALLAEKLPAQPSDPAARQARNMLRSFAADTETPVSASAPQLGRAPLSAERRARTFAILLEARTTKPDADRQRASNANEARREVWRAEVASAAAARPEPSLVFDSAPRPLERKALASGGLADRLVFAGPRALPVAATLDEQGHLWVLFSAGSGSDSAIVWRELNATATELLREIRLEHARDYFFNPRHNVFRVRSGRIFSALRSGLHIIDLATQTHQVVALDGLENGNVWTGASSDRLWLSGEPGLIYEYRPDTATLSLVSSAMRVPATNRLDARPAYQVTALFERDGRQYAWIDGDFLHEWNPSTHDWREIYSTRSHWRPGQPYPLDLILAALGPGETAGNSQESFFRVLSADAALSGRLAGEFSNRDAFVLEQQNWRSAAYLADRIWTLYTDKGGASSLLSKRRGTGQLSAHPLGRERYSGLHAFETGFLIIDERGHTLLHIPRQRVDPGYSPAETPPANTSAPRTP